MDSHRGANANWLADTAKACLTWRTLALVLAALIVVPNLEHSYQGLKGSRSKDLQDNYLLQSQPLELPAPAPAREDEEKDCTVSVTYVPAAWEEDFVANMTKYQGSVQGLCAPLKKYKPLVDEWLALYKHIEAHGWNSLPSWSKSTFSYFRRTQTCKSDGSEETTDVPIEPLVSFLRHPMYLCFDATRKYHVNKDYMLLSHPGLTVSDPSAKKFMFDAGASSYRQGAGGASSAWFIETYRKNGVEFDEMFCWEANGRQKDLIREYPFDILVKTHYFAVPVSARKDSFHNILNWIQRLAKVEDFVVFKLDIDTPEVESAMAEQLLDPKNARLVDEFFFEDHVSKSPMEDHGWTHEAKHHDLAKSIVYFQKLRRLGIRAHSWV